MTGAYGLVPRWNDAVSKLAGAPCPVCGELITVEETERREHVEECERLAQLKTLPMMTESEARACVDDITGHLRTARTRIVELYEREGWKALGYMSWRECVIAEFGQGKSHMYRQLAAAFVEKVISPNGEIGTIPESHVRPLTPLAPGEQVLVWQVVTDTAPNGKVTEAHVRSVVNVLKEVTATGAIDNGSGQQIPVSQATTGHLKAAVTEETYERLKRQETYVSEKLAKKPRLGSTTPPASLTALDTEQHQAYDCWLSCHTAELPQGLTRPEVNDTELFSNFEPKVYSVWNFQAATNEVRHFGNIPPEIIDNLLYYYTRPFNVVFDPFGGGGSTIDRCRERHRRYYVSDLTPPPARPDMRPHDITTGLPADLPDIDLVFLDPPYWKQAAGRYSDKPTDLANMSLEAFIEAIGSIARCFAALWAERPAARLALIIGAYKEDGKYTDLPFLCYEAVQKYLRPIQRIQVPYSTQVHGGAYVARAKEHKEILYLSRDLMIFGV